jgi:lipoic acid synthetase
MAETTLPRPRAPKPPWLKVRAPSGDSYFRLKGLLRGESLHTVCEEARCPNVAECWAGGTATFMILGDVCTRGCRFCAVRSGNPGGVVDAGEPARVAKAAAAMGLAYVVVTTVDRDDLSDGGAAHFAATVRALEVETPGILVETLSGDFRGLETSLATLAESGAEVLAHNVETVERLTPEVRDRRASYGLSLRVLGTYRRLRPDAIVKSSIQLGHGETDGEVLRTLDDLRSAGCEAVTLGQYLQPTEKHRPVAEFAPPARFEALRTAALDRGFLSVSSGPLVRSSYRAGERFLEDVVRARRVGGTAAPRRTSASEGPS